MDFVKRKLGVEVQFGQVFQFMVYNVAAKMTIFRNLGVIDAGIEVVPVPELRRGGFDRCLLLRTVPVGPREARGVQHRRPRPGDRNRRQSRGGPDNDSPDQDPERPIRPKTPPGPKPN